ncbi:hypothetical protein, partial [Bartonella sp. AA86SXKL]|uniref:hypothetical protein n=1 Tax=Bartonella sp. AA86SXKL TaxID=3243441 RepID=UPI0035D0545C
METLSVPRERQDHSINTLYRINETTIELDNVLLKGKKNSYDDELDELITIENGTFIRKFGGDFGGDDEPVGFGSAVYSALDA